MTPYVEHIARMGMVGIAMSNAGPGVAPFGGRQRVLGTNPFAWSMPIGDWPDPLTFDIATAAKPGGPIRTSAAFCLEDAALIRADVEREGIDAAVIAACSFRVNADVFRLSPAFVERVNLREQVAWSHPAGHEETQALAEDTRVRIVSLLIDAPLDVTEISGRVGISQYNASKHLRVLREAGLLQLEKHGRRHLYALTEGIGRRMAEGGVLDLGCCSFQFDGETRGAQPGATGRRRRAIRR